MDPYAHCETLVRDADKDRYLAALFVRRAVRPHVLAILAFNIELAAVRERASNPLAGEVRLQWWRDALAGRAAGGAGGHPVAAALFDTVGRFSLPLAPLERMIEARAFDLGDEPMPTSEAFEDYVRATAVPLFALPAELLVSGHPEIAAAAGHAGLAYGITGLLRAFPFHASRGWIYLPADVLYRNGAHHELILRGRTNEGLLRALAELRGKAREHLAAALRLLPALEAAAAAFLPLALAGGYLDRMERRGYDPFATPVEVPQWRRQWMLWRAARRLP